MSVEERFASLFAEVKEQRETLKREEDRLRAGGGGGTSGGMEERLTRLERNVDQLAKETTEVRVLQATLVENVRHLPTKPWMFSTLGGLLAAIAVVVGLIVRFLPAAH